MDALAARKKDPVLENGKKLLRLAVAGAVKLLLLLGTRRSETLNMRWADIDEHAETWTVPGMFRKGGRTHVVPVPKLALRILEDLKPASSSKEWVYVGKRGASLANNPFRCTEAVRDLSGLDFPPRPAAHLRHRLRPARSFGEHRQPHLGHKAVAGTIAVSGIYDRFDRLPEIRSALADWSTYVEKLMTGEKRGGEVVAFSRKGARAQKSHAARQRGARV
jgi:integrase